MSLIPRELDDADNPRLTYKTTLENLVRALSNERCLIFLGAGAGVDTSQPSLPTGTQLAQELARKCGLTWHESVPLSTVAYYYEFYFDRENLNELLVERIGNPALRPSTANRLVADLISLLEKRGRSTFTITTNYDQQLETAYREITGRSCGVITYKGGWDAHDREKRLHDGLGERPPKFWLPRQQSYIYKMHGCISQPSGRGLVVTEEDYINFLANTMSQNEHKRMLHYVLGEIAMRTILFIGYSLSDWNFRVLYKATVEDAEGKEGKSYAVQYRPTAALESDQDQIRWRATDDFWGKKNVNIITSDASDFLRDLLKIADAAIPAQQLAAAGS